MTTADELAACACTNITMQATLSMCVQKSCGFLDQNRQLDNTPVRALANSLQR